MDNDKKLMNVNVKSFIGALLMLLVLMILTYVLTFILPSGTYVRVMQGGSSAIVPGTYTEIAGGITFWKWLASPILVLFADGGGTIIAIIAFLLVIGGVFTSLIRQGCFPTCWAHCITDLKKGNTHCFSLPACSLWHWVHWWVPLKSVYPLYPLRQRLPTAWVGMRWWDLA